MERSSERIAETFQPGAVSLGQQRLFFGPRLLEAGPHGPRDPDRFGQPCLVFGFFGLAGIVVNDSIILIVSYKALKQSGAPWREAIVEAACLRLRAVLLTSLTTIGGLTPLMFETSLQAQFLIPMAVSIAFGLGVATFLVLLLGPTSVC